jgi:hypothetical protein
VSKETEWKDSGVGIDLPDGRSLLGFVIGEDAELRKLIVTAVNAYLRQHAAPAHS